MVRVAVYGTCDRGSFVFLIVQGSLVDICLHDRGGAKGYIRCRRI
jgi:hypothetical protein